MKLQTSLKLFKYNNETHFNFIEPLTELLHEAYAPLALKGMKYLATHQPPAKTLERLLEGESYLGFIDENLVGTITLYKEKPTSTCEYYRRAGVYSFGQFAIKPSYQGHGFGSEIMNRIEKRAKELGATELALDTSEYADHLIQMYEKRGYTHVSYTQWDVTNYRSVIMSKILQLNKKFDAALLGSQETLHQIDLPSSIIELLPKV